MPYTSYDKFIHDSTSMLSFGSDVWVPQEPIRHAYVIDKKDIFLP
jgi:hypothetical protein